MSEPNDEGYGLLFPFVTVATAGGPHDDESYVAGYEMGRLDATLAGTPPVHQQPIHTVSRAQADLIAMHYGYVMRVVSEHDDEWLTVEFTAAEDDDDR